MQVSSNLTIQYQTIHGDEVNVSVNSGGKWNDIHQNPAIFPATQEWYDKLVHTYPDLEEAPTNQKNSKEVIQAMLAIGKKYVACWASDISKNPNKTDPLVAVQEISTSVPSFIDEIGTTKEVEVKFDEYLEWERRGSNFYATNVPELICIYQSLLDSKTYEVCIDLKTIGERTSLTEAKLLAQKAYQEMFVNS